MSTPSSLTPAESRIDTEQPADTIEVAKVNEQAFGRPDEGALVDAVRRAGAATLSLVARVASPASSGAPAPHTIVGHILFSPVSIDGQTEPRGLGLGPVAVRPAYKRQGHGQRLIRAGLEQARTRGYAYVIVIGHPEYYPRFGFTPASRFGLRYEHPVADPVFMALELVPGALASATG